MRVLRWYSSTSSVVIRKPLRTKKMSTPKKPPSTWNGAPADERGVEQHDAEHGDGAHAVERRPVAEVERPPLPCRRHLSP